MYGFVRVAAGVPVVEVANVKKNVEEIIETIQMAAKKQVEVLALPELCVTGYTCADLFYQDTLIRAAEEGVQQIAEATKEMSLVFTLGAPMRLNHQLFNVALVLYKGEIIGAVPKVFIPNHSEFYEKRWFSSGDGLERTTVQYAGQNFPITKDMIFIFPHRKELKIGVEICEDLWTPEPPSVRHMQAGANLILNLSASNEVATKREYRRTLVAAQSARITAAYVYASAGLGESTTDLVFGGHCLIAENGTVLEDVQKFTWENQLVYTDVDIEKMENLRRQNTNTMFAAPIEEIKKDYCILEIAQEESEERPLARAIEPNPFVPVKNEHLTERCEEIFAIQYAGLAKRLKHTHAQTAVIAVSGGLDSTLALLCTAKAFDFLEKPRSEIIAITMPGFGTTGRTYENALSLMKTLGVTIREISIKESVLQHFKDIDHDPSLHDVTYENAQARERMQVAMDVANQENGLVIGTGDLSELALGFTTYNGDHMSMYGVNCSIPKTLVRQLVDWVSRSEDLGKAAFGVLQDILDTPVSPELLPPDENGEIHQKTEQVVGPYELTDFFLYYFIRFGFSPTKIYWLAQNAFQGKYTNAEILHWLDSFVRRFFSQQFKRSCVPDGPKVGSIALSPRGDWRMPSDASSELWLEEIEGLKRVL